MIGRTCRDVKADKRGVRYIGMVHPFLSDVQRAQCNAQDHVPHDNDLTCRIDPPTFPYVPESGRCS